MQAKEAKEIMTHEIAPNVISLNKAVTGLFQTRVLEIQNDHALLGLVLVDKDNPEKVLKVMGEPQWVKVKGKITLHGATIDLNFNGI